MADQKDYKLVKRQIFVRKGQFLERYPFSFVKSIDLRTGTVEWSGMMPDSAAVHMEKDRMLYRDGENQVFWEPNPWIISYEESLICPCQDPNGLVTGIRGGI